MKTELIPTFMILLLTMINPLAYAGNLSLGIEGGVYGTPYKVKHADYWALPYVGYEAGNYYVDGTEAGYNVYQSDTQQLRAKVYYSSNEFDASEGSTAQLRSLRDRHSTMMAGMTYQYITSWGAFSGTLGADTLNHSRGITANLSYTLMKQFGALTIVPTVGVDWFNHQYTRYYFGISKSEAAKSNLSAYNTDSAVVPYALVAINYDWNNKWSSWLEITGRFYPSAITDSPMINKEAIAELTVGLSYGF